MTEPHPAFHAIAKPVGPICNLDCSYCYYLEKERLYPETASWRLDQPELEAFIKQYIEAQQVPVVSFTWQGGEPTLAGLEYFQRIVNLQRRHAMGKRVENCLQTNAMFLDDEWCEFLARERFLVGVSIDGPQPLHDMYRVSKGGQGSFDRVMDGIERLKQFQVEFNTLTVVHRGNADYGLDVYRFLKSIGSRYLQFLPVVERVHSADDTGLVQLALPDARDAAVTDWSVLPDQHGRFLCEIFNEWVQHDVSRIFVQQFDVALESWLGLTPALCVFRETCGAAIAVEHNGDVYSCDHFVFPDYLLGNVSETSLSELVNSPRQQAFGEAKCSTLPRLCRECDVRFACHGECPKNRFMSTPDGEPGLNYLCPSYLKFFRHIDRYMTFMANELRSRRPPANVMHYARLHPPAAWEV